MAITTTSFEIIFKLASKEFQITDIAPYPGADLADISSSIIITDPSGDVSGPFVVSTDLSYDRNINIPMPLTSSGEIMQGQYVFAYTAVDSSDSSSAGETKVFDYCYKSPTAEVEMTYDCIQPKLTATDVSNYTVGGVTPTISRDISIHYPIATGVSPVNATTQAICTSVFYTQTHTGKVVADLLYDQTNGVFIRDIVTGAKEVNVVCDNTLCDLYCCLLGMYTKFKDAQGTNRTLAADLESKWLRAESIRSLIKDSYECNKEENVAGLVADVLKLGDCQPGCGCSEGDAPTLIGAVSSTPVVPTTNTGGGGIGGEVNTASSVGTGEDLTAGKVAEDLQFKSLIAGGSIKLTSDANTITIAYDGATGGSGSSTAVDAGQGVEVTSTPNGTLTTYTVGIDQATWDKINSLRNAVVEAGAGTSVVETTGTNGEAVYTVSSSSDPENSIHLLYRFKLQKTALPQIELVSSSVNGDSFQVPELSFIRQIPLSVVARDVPIQYEEITSVVDLLESKIKILATNFVTSSGTSYIPTSCFSGLYKQVTVNLTSNPFTALGFSLDHRDSPTYTTVSSPKKSVIYEIPSLPSTDNVNEFITNVYESSGLGLTYEKLVNTKQDYFYFTIKIN